VADAFATRLLAWWDRAGRKDLPWQTDRSPYRVWVSEVMLQQTQVATVLPYYARFMARFPDIAALAAAPLDEVLHLWTGLGYYARARNLQRAAVMIVAEHGGEFPRDYAAVAALPGIGRSTAGAILALALGERHPILDGNAERVLARVHAVAGHPKQPATARKLWDYAERHLPDARIADYTQALMDLGATVCMRRPDCARCPLSRRCIARREDRVSELPAPRPKKALPLRRATWLVLRRNDEVLLERRPSPGIWGGLWCFPEQLKKVRRGRKLQPIEHGFTHFRLHIQPVLCRIRKEEPVGPSLRWMAIADVASAAVPTPVRSLIGLLR
jgi:A/G-specific adenine glycosylase